MYEGKGYGTGEEERERGREGEAGREGEVESEGEREAEKGSRVPGRYRQMALKEESNNNQTKHIHNIKDKAS